MTCLHITCDVPCVFVVPEMGLNGVNESLDLRGID